MLSGTFKSVGWILLMGCVCHIPASADLPELGFCPLGGPIGWFNRLTDRSDRVYVPRYIFPDHRWYPMIRNRNGFLADGTVYRIPVRDSFSMLNRRYVKTLFPPSGPYYYNTGGFLPLRPEKMR
jgi:hypothetical protein